MEKEIMYTIRINGEILRYESGDEEIYWDLREAVLRARGQVREIGLNRKIEVSLWKNKKPLVVIERLANGEINERGAEDSDEFNRYLKATLIGCAPNQVDEYIPSGYVLSKYQDQILTQGGWKPWYESGVEKVYATLKGALRRVHKELNKKGDGTVVISRRFLNPRGVEIDRQVASVWRLGEDGDIEFGINGALPSVTGACTRLQIREMDISRFQGEWSEYFWGIRPYRYCGKEHIIFP